MANTLHHRDRDDFDSLWWPEERIKATLDTKYIVNQLQPASVPRLFDLPKWGEGLTSETYMEYILLKAGRLFLILNEIGIPDRIFALVDESCEDEDLPIAEQNVDRLCLSPDANNPILDNKFFHTQWRFSVRGISEGDHVKYTGNEGVPIQVLRQPSITNDLQGRDDTVDKVVLAGSVSKVLMRTQIQVGGAPHFFSADEVLAEIKALRKLAHQHVLSIYASYLADDNICVLFTCAETERTLQSFLTDEPPSFKRLSKEHRRATLITWPHCLVSALAWLHAQGHFHGAIRPSNVLIDADFNIALGQFHVLDSLLAPPRVHDLESYQYSAPERWVRTAAPVQPTPPVSGHNLLLPSGGRTGRRKPPSRLALSTLNESPPSSPDLPRPDSAASRGTVIRIGLPGSPSRFSFAFSTSSSSSSSTASSTNTDSMSPKPQKRTWLRSKPSLQRLKPSTPSIITSAPSISSSSSSSSTTPSLSPTSPFKTSTAPADLFSLAAITLDILTHLCKRTSHAFSAHRSARNRSAGRGGGMADASFHLPRNAVQVQSWIALLEGDALKRCRRDRGSDRAFWAVPKMLIVLRAMLSAEPGKRPSAKRVRRCFEGAVGEIPKRGGEVRVHCVREKKEEVVVEPQQVRREIVEEKKVQVQREEVDVRVGSIESSSVSDFEFGFSDGGSESEVEMSRDDDEVDRDALFEEEEIVQVDRVSPQLSLPALDLHLTGIEGLKLQ